MRSDENEKGSISVFQEMMAEGKAKRLLAISMEGLAAPRPSSPVQLGGGAPAHSLAIGCSSLCLMPGGIVTRAGCTITSSLAFVDSFFSLKLPLVIRCGCCKTFSKNIMGNSSLFI